MVGDVDNADTPEPDQTGIGGREPIALHRERVGRGVQTAAHVGAADGARRIGHVDDYRRGVVAEDERAEGVAVRHRDRRQVAGAFDSDRANLDRPRRIGDVNQPQRVVTAHDVGVATRRCDAANIRHRPVAANRPRLAGCREVQDVQRVGHGHQQQWAEKCDARGRVRGGVAAQHERVARVGHVQKLQTTPGQDDGGQRPTNGQTAERRTQGRALSQERRSGRIGEVEGHQPVVGANVERSPLRGHERGGHARLTLGPQEQVGSRNLAENDGDIGGCGPGLALQVGTDLQVVRPGRNGRNDESAVRIAYGLHGRGMGRHALDRDHRLGRLVAGVANAVAVQVDA